MGGVDKGLQTFHGVPLVRHTLDRLRSQTGPQISTIAINANRHLTDYAAFGVPVWPDTLAGHAGPLAGFLTGLTRCGTDWLLTVPCDTPLFPLDLADRLAEAVHREHADLAMAAACEDDGQLHAQPVFCLLRQALRQDLAHYLDEGGRKVRQWTARHKAVIVPFEQRDDDPQAFRNANTLAELRALEQI